MSNQNLYDKETAIHFYEKRYRENYMDEWPEDKKERVFHLIQELKLPSFGRALDFGCGNGVFTDVLKQALPGWEVYGCDITDVSIENAAKRFPECHFFVSNDEMKPEKKFDFLFSHHVLEHVYDIDKSMEEMKGYLVPGGFMFHIMPCGNEGSFEDHIARLRKNGINKQKGNALFFEDEGHVRRLKSDELTAIAARKGFSVKKEFFANHKYGSIEWMTRSTLKFLKDLTDPSMAKDKAAEEELKKIRKELVREFYLRWPASMFLKAKDPSKPAIRYPILVFGYIPYLLSKPVYNKLIKKREEEWLTKNQEKNGTEMYMLFQLANQ